MQPEIEILLFFTTIGDNQDQTRIDCRFRLRSKTIVRSSHQCKQSVQTIALFNAMETIIHYTILVHRKHGNYPSVKRQSKYGEKNPKKMFLENFLQKSIFYKNTI